MATSHGTKAEIYYNGYDISTFLNSITVSLTRDKADASHFKSQVKTYTGGLIDAALSADGWFDGTPQAIDDLMFAASQSPLPNHWLYWIYGRAFGSVGYGFFGPSTKYESKTEIGATASVSVEVSSKALDRVLSLAADVVVSATGNGTSYDNGATALVNPGTFIVHGTTTGSTMTVVLQDSADNSTFADIATATFTGGTVPDPAEQVYHLTGSSNPLRRYVRIRYSGAGTILTAAFGNN